MNQVGRTEPGTRRLVWVVLALLVIAGYVAGVGMYALRAPFVDDFEMLAGANAFSGSKTLEEAWLALSAQHNEHRPVVVRLVFWLVDLLPGPFHVALVSLVGNFFLVLMFALVLREGRRVTAPHAFILIAAVLMFNLGLSESSIWAIAAVSNFGALAIVLAMLVLLSLGGMWIWAGLFAALIAVGLQGNGLLAPFLGAAYLFANARRISSAVWLAVAVAVAIWFLTGYTSSSGGGDIVALASRAGEIIVYALAFCGSVVGFGGESLGALNIVFVSIAALAGTILIGSSAYAALNGGLRDGKIALWVNLFILLTAFATALSRIDYGVQQALVPRYHINSCLMVAMTLIALLDLGEADPIGIFIRKSMGVFGVIACVYAVAVIPILGIVHGIYQSPSSTEAAWHRNDREAVAPASYLKRNEIRVDGR